MAHRPDRFDFRRIGVGDGQPAVAAVHVDDVHDAPVGQAGHGQPGGGRQGRLVVERRGEHLAGLGQELHLLPCHLRVTAGDPLGLVQPGPLERLRALTRERQDEVAVVGGEPAVVTELELEAPEHAATGDEGHGHHRAAPEAPCSRGESGRPGSRPTPRRPDARRVTPRPADLADGRDRPG